MTLPRSGPSRYGYHRLATYAVCPRKFAYQHLLRLEPLRCSEPLALGILGHLGLMHFYLGRIGDPAAKDPVEVMRAAPARVVYQFQRASELIAAYRTQYANETIRVLDVEREFEVRIGGCPYTQRADLVVEIARGVCIFDHKFEANIEPSVFSRHACEGQFIGYEILGTHLLTRLYGLPWGGVYVNAIKTAPPYSFRRGRLRVPSERIRSFPPSMARHLRRLQEDLDSSREPYDYPCNFEACFGMRFRCEYKVLCDRGRTAEVEFAPAVDDATTAREGSGA